MKLPEIKIMSNLIALKLNIYFKGGVSYMKNLKNIEYEKTKNNKKLLNNQFKSEIFPRKHCPLLRNF